MRKIKIAALGAFLVIISALFSVQPASAQGVTRICVLTVVNPITGAQGCVDASTTSPLPVIMGAGSTIGVAQGSTTSGQLGPLVQGAVTTGQPSYITGQTSPLSLGLSGELRTMAGITRSVCVTPTLTAATYGTNVVMGGLLTFANMFGPSLGGVIQTVSVTSKTVQTVGLTFYPFVTNPAASTWTDHSAAAINVADVGYVRNPTYLSSPASDLGTHTVWGVPGIGQAIHLSTTTLYGILVPQATTATFGTTDLQVCVKTLSDD